MRAAFAQPSGLALDGNTLYVADAESNTIRAVELPPVNTRDARSPAAICSSSATRTAAGDAVRLQHPLGVAAHDGRVFIADTYNHKIKLLDPATRQGDDAGRHRHRGSRRTAPAARAQFAEPGGLSIADGGSTWPTPTTTPSGRSTSRPARCRTLQLAVDCTPPLAYSYLRGRG